MSRFAVVVVACLSMAAHTVRAEIIDRVLAIVSGRVILLSDVVAAQELGLVAATASEDPVRGALHSLIDRALVEAEVDRYAPPTPEEEAVDRELRVVRGRFTSSQAFDRAVARVGFDAGHLREWLRQDLRIRAYLDERFIVVPPTENELETFYQDHPERFTAGGIRVPFDDVRSLVVQAVNEARRGELVDEWISNLRRRADIRDLYDRPSPNRRSSSTLSPPSAARVAID